MTTQRSSRSDSPIRIGDLVGSPRGEVAAQLVLSAVASDFTLEIMRRAYRLFDGDLVLFLVFSEIAHYNVARAIRSLDIHDQLPARLRRKDVLGALEQQRVSPCNALSISDATGIPRETVRRKVKELERRRMLRREGARNLTLTHAAIEQLQDSGLNVTRNFLETARIIRLLQEALARRQEE
ncbi:MAG: hypothetical protein IPP18_14870 [Rhodocyclaceae bacterium]|nr:hypothetical protein [Rhodocyclaceae bacterium]